MDAGRRDETRQRSHPGKSASDEQQDPNTDNPYAHHYIQEKHTQQTERLVWCVHGELEEHNKRNQTIEAPNNQENDPKDAQEEYHPIEQQKAEY